MENGNNGFQQSNPNQPNYSGQYYQQYQYQTGGSSFQNPNFGQQPPSTPPDNNQVLAIITTVISAIVCCCTYTGFIALVLGIIAIVLSSQVNSKFMMGDVAGAEKSAKNSKLLSLIAIGILILGIVIFIILLATGASTEMMEEYMRILEEYK